MGNYERPIDSFGFDTPPDSKQTIGMHPHEYGSRTTHTVKFPLKGHADAILIDHQSGTLNDTNSSTAPSTSQARPSKALPTPNMFAQKLATMSPSDSSQSSCIAASTIPRGGAHTMSPSNRPALIPLTPNVSRHGKERPNNAPSVSEKQHTSVRSKRSGRIFSNAESPRKLLWPYAPRQRRPDITRTNGTSDQKYKQHFGSPRKPQPSFQIHQSQAPHHQTLQHPLPHGYMRGMEEKSGNMRHPRRAPARQRPYPQSRARLRGSPNYSNQILHRTNNDSTAEQMPRSLMMPQQVQLHSASDDIISVPEAGYIRDGAFTEPLQPESCITNVEPIVVVDDLAGKTAPNLRFYAARILPSWQVWAFRISFGLLVLAINVSLLVAYFETNRHLYLLAILAFVKSKDLLCTVTDIGGVSYFAIRRLISTPEQVSTKWIASLVCAYAETDEQIMKTFRSLAEQDLKQHKQVICIILDGKDPNILSRFSKVYHKLRRSYFTWKGSTGELVIYSGLLEQTPTILIKKIRNAGKKDSLILGHDMFNYPRSDMPRNTSRLRREIFTHLLPSLTGTNLMSSFDFVFCTDADSTIHTHSLHELANTLSRQESAIAACGVLVAELALPKLEWKAWHLYQQFQYTFGQYVRRQAEGIWGRVTCLPGCITMIKVRPEMGKAISMYAQPVTTHNILEHQVQYLGTDRRLTYCILAQGKHLRTLFVPGALCETVVPDSLEHYLSQRRRWASNAYFNDYYYAAGKQQFAITRLVAIIDIVRQTLVFYRVVNTGLFIYSLIQLFYIIKIVPTLILTKAPVTWFMLVVLIKEKVLRQRIHKLLLGMCINQIISPFLSVIVFANVLLNVGSQVWGTTGASTIDPRHPATPYVAIAPQPTWSPTRLASIVRKAVRDVGGAVRSHSYTPQTQFQRDKPRFDGRRAASLPMTPGAKAALAASNPDSELRLRTSVLSPFKGVTYN